MLIALGITSGIVLSLLAMYAFYRVQQRRIRDGSADLLMEAQESLEEEPARALTLVARSFWASPSRVYTPDEAIDALAAIRLLRRLLAERDREVATQLDPLESALSEIASGEVAEPIEGDLLDPVAEFLHDVAEDRILAEAVLEKVEDGDFDYAFSRR